MPVLYNQRYKDRTLYDGVITGDPATRIMLTEMQKGRPGYDLKKAMRERLQRINGIDGY
jgi:hypothetical protein